MNDGQLPALMQRITEGDHAAAERLVQQYEPEIRRAVRVRLTDPRLRRVLDSGDVCQSVFANFFVRAAAGDYDLSQSGELASLLVAMARNKLLDHVRKLRSLKRDQRREGADGSAVWDGVADSAVGPATQAEQLDLMQEVRQRLTDDEQRLMDYRAAGLEWPEIAREVGEKADALRKRLTRALDRVTEQLGIDKSRR